MPYRITAVYHGPTISSPAHHDPYADAKTLNLFKQLPQHSQSHINAGEIVERILKSRALYEERQRVKGVKGIGEEAVRRREDMEKEKADRDKKVRQTLERTKTAEQKYWEIEREAGV